MELVGLCYSVVEWLASLYSNGSYPHEGVSIEDGDENVFTYADWAAAIKVNGSHDQTSKNSHH